MDLEWINRPSLSLDLSVGRSPNQVSDDGVLEAKFNELSEENERLIKIIGAICMNHAALRNQYGGLTGTLPDKGYSYQTRKRKIDASDINSNNGTEHSFKRFREDVKPNVYTTYTRIIASDSCPVVRDGHHWKKYGQKVTRDNPSPRAYFRCSIAPSCPAKKKVQRSAEDMSILVSVYEGEHNHGPPSPTSPASYQYQNGSHLRLVSPNSAESTATTHDLTQESVRSDVGRACEEKNIVSMERPKELVDQIASLLTKDPNFTAALASAMSGKVFEQLQTHNISSSTVLPCLPQMLELKKRILKQGASHSH